MRKLIFLILSAAVMIAIFGFSSQAEKETYALSGKVTTAVNETAQLITNEIPIAKEANFYEKHLKKYLTEYKLRKTAHVLLYTLLSFCISGVFCSEKNWKSAVFPVAISVMYAVSDEVHQIFVGGRGAAFADVLVDSAGILFGMALFKLIYYLIVVKKNSFRKE